MLDFMLDSIAIFFLKIKKKVQQDIVTVSV